MHFQAGTRDFLPLISDYKRLKATHTDVLVEDDKYTVFCMKNYLRTVYCIESGNAKESKLVFNSLYTNLQQSNTEEPMMNVVCTFEDGIWYTFVLPRKEFRPWQFTAEGDQQLMVSPATVEMCGIFITPIEQHFEKITKEDVISILEQVSL